jgi:putative redox protein
MSTGEKFMFPGSSGVQLAARLDRPSGKIRAFALFAHCFACSKDIFAAARIAARLVEQGIAVLRFDFTGLGHSEGEFANTNFSSNVGDLVAAADHLRNIHRAPAILIGHSLGGAAVLAADARIPEAVAVATIAAPFDPAHASHNFSDAIAEIEAKGEAEVRLGGKPFVIRKQFLDDIAVQNQAERIAHLRKALIVFHAPLDEIVGIENASKIFLAAKHPRSFVSLDDADHLLTRRADARYVAEVIGAWAGRYIDRDEIEEYPAPTAQPGTVVVAEAAAGTLAQQISFGGNFTMRADEPTDYGGTDTGPGPYDLLIAALGACTVMTMRMYARRKGIPLRRGRVALSHGKIHAADCADCETKEGKIDRIDRVISLEGDLTKEQRDGLLRIAEKCPVHRTLTNEISIVTKLADA